MCQSKSLILFLTDFLHKLESMASNMALNYQYMPRPSHSCRQKHVFIVMTGTTGLFKGVKCDSGGR